MALSQTTTGVDANSTSSVTTAIDMDGYFFVGMYVAGATGTHATHIVTLQSSPDGTTWFDTTHAITGVGSDTEINCYTNYIRAKVTTAEGGASTVNIYLIVKP